MMSAASFIQKKNGESFDDLLELPSGSHEIPYQFGTMDVFSHSESSTSNSQQSITSVSPPSYSALQDFDDEFHVDGLQSKIVALDLNVDNHIDAKSSKSKLDYSLSGACSMTPNPRSVYKSPRKPSDTLENEFSDSSLKSKLFFDDLDEKKTDPPKFNTSSLNKFQHIVLPNGTPAVVLPLYACEQHQEHFQRSHTSRKTNTPPTSAIIPNEIALCTFEGKLFSMSKDQNGCRYLQDKVSQQGMEAVEFIMTEVSHKLIELMMDPFGNYLFQKIIETVPSRERKNILLSVEQCIVKAAVNLHGTRCVQKFVEICAKDEDQVEVLKGCLHLHVTKLSMDTNGNHVLQRCLQHWKDEDRQFIFKSMLKDVLQVTRHRHGCCVYQRCLDAAGESWRMSLVSKIEKHAVCLVTDPFGNYVVQYVLDKSGRSDTDSVIQNFLGKFCELSMQKFSSNVIEKCVAQASVQMKARIMEELIQCNRVKDMLEDQYANYVVQRSILLSESSQCWRLLQQVIPHLDELSKFNPTCCRKIAMKAVKRFPHLASHSKLSAFLCHK